MSEGRIVLDYGAMLSDRLGGRGVSPDSLARVADRFGEIHADVRARRDSGELGFYQLAYDDAQVRAVQDLADTVQQFEVLVVLGIGGSALGTTALRDALRPPLWNELDDEQREHYPRLYVLDNVDPATVGALLDRLEPGRTLFNVVSKSGSTAETMAQFLVVREWLEAALGDAWRRHLVLTTDPEKGFLRDLARDDEVPSLVVPPAVGGRFSVLSPVGLFPAGMIGIDTPALVAGARAMVERCDTDVLADNPAATFAALQYLADEEAGAPIHVMMPYADRLRSIGDWYRQLWAESLGKRLDRSGAEVHRGPTPLNAVGATDQHSQVQLFMEGPFDKTVTFLAVTDPGDDVAIPSLYADRDAVGYLGGATLGGLLDAERRATAAALTRHGRMNMTLELPTVSAHSLGQLLMLLEIATVYAGALYGVDPLDQPGVELGKQLTYGLMGRPGFDVPADADDAPPLRVE